MKQTNTFIVLRNKEGGFLETYKNNFEHLASLLEAEPVKVVADYTLTTIDGNELPPVEKSDQLVMKFLRRVANGNDEG